jgi:hypothetical protein
MIAPMGIADSPLQDRVIFVQGAPRSGTTWLLTLLATHPQIAGVETESHLFAFGLDRLFDNFEGRRQYVGGLSSYLERREQLVDLARDLCDGVLLAMRARVSPGLEPAFVVEKTPTSFPQKSLDLRRKRDCYPDAWYLHIVRDGDAVTRSLMKAPWMKNRSEAHCRGFWRYCVDATRECLGDHPRYRELSYEDLCEDPVNLADELFRWLGIEAGADVLANVRRLSRERYSEHAAIPDGDGGESAADLARRPLRLAAKARSTLGRARRAALAPARPETVEPSPLTFEFAKAMRERDPDALRTLTADSVALVYRSAAGDLNVSGDEGRRGLLEIAAALFGRSHFSEVWAASGGGPREWWTRAAGQPFWAIMFSALDGDATRVDLSFGLTVKDGLITEVVVVSAGPLTGRPLRDLDRLVEPRSGDLRTDATHEDDPREPVVGGAT